MSASAARAPLGPAQLAPATIAKAMALRNMPLPPELMSARQRQGKGGKPAPVDALGYRRLGADLPVGDVAEVLRSEEHTSELQSLMRISYAVFCLKKKNKKQHTKERLIHITQQLSHAISQ